MERMVQGEIIPPLRQIPNLVQKAAYSRPLAFLAIRKPRERIYIKRKEIYF